jgi:hypothetical protein
MKHGEVCWEPWNQDPSRATVPCLGSGSCQPDSSTCRAGKEAEQRFTPSQDIGRNRVHVVLLHSPCVQLSVDQAYGGVETGFVKGCRGANIATRFLADLNLDGYGKTATPLSASVARGPVFAAHTSPRRRCSLPTLLPLLLSRAYTDHSRSTKYRCRACPLSLHIARNSGTGGPTSPAIAAANNAR